MQIAGISICAQRGMHGESERAIEKWKYIPIQSFHTLLARSIIFLPTLLTFIRKIFCQSFWIWNFSLFQAWFHSESSQTHVHTTLLYAHMQRKANSSCQISIKHGYGILGGELFIPIGRHYFFSSTKLWSVGQRMRVQMNQGSVSSYVGWGAVELW